MLNMKFGFLRFVSKVQYIFFSDGREIQIYTHLQFLNIFRYNFWKHPQNLATSKGQHSLHTKQIGSFNIINTIQAILSL